MRDSYWNDYILISGVKCDECKSKLPSKSVKSIYVRSIRDVCERNLKRVILGHLHIHSIRNKFDLLTKKKKRNFDIMVISETKLDESFPNWQFKIPEYVLPLIYFEYCL